MKLSFTDKYIVQVFNVAFVFLIPFIAQYPEFNDDDNQRKSNIFFVIQDHANIISCERFTDQSEMAKKILSKAADAIPMACTVIGAACPPALIVTIPTGLIVSGLNWISTNAINLNPANAGSEVVLKLYTELQIDNATKIRNER